MLKQFRPVTKNLKCRLSAKYLVFMKYVSLGKQKSAFKAVVDTAKLSGTKLIKGTSPLKPIKATMPTKPMKLKMPTKPIKASNIAKSIVLISLASLLSACFSLPNLNPFSDEQAENRGELNGAATLNGSGVLSEQEQIKRNLLLAGKSQRPSLKSLNLQPVKIQDLAVPILSLQQKRDEYELLLPFISDPIQKQQAAFRLADLKMLIAEQAQEEGIDLQVANASFDVAIKNYRQVLKQFTIVSPAKDAALSEEQQALNRKQMDAMYQLTRALDLSAQPEQSMQVAKQFFESFSVEKFTLTPYHLELYFRVGEYYFNRQQYQAATNYYSKVLEHGHAGGTGNFYAISAYMLGWSHFKLDDYPQAMRGFAKMLDVNLLNNNFTNNNSSENTNQTAIETVRQESAEGLTQRTLQKQPLSQLPLSKGDLRLVKDAVRVMALTFSYQGSGKAIDAFFADIGPRAYEQLIVDELAQQHLDNDRFADSANVLANFANQQPFHPRAVEFYIRHIDAFVLGDFPARVLIAKEDFVNIYSLGNGVVTNVNTPVGRDALPYLRTYIKELAQTEHSIAQSIDQVVATRIAMGVVNSGSSIYRNGNSGGFNAGNINNANTGFVGQNTSQQQDRAWAGASNADLQALSQASYTKAKNYYENFIRTFSPAADVIPLRFYLAESLVALQEYEQAIKVFENYAYSDSVNAFDVSALELQKIDMPKPVEAAYAALLVYQTIAEKDTKSNDQRSNMLFEVPLDRRQMSQAKFANTFAADPRAPEVALTLMQDLFAYQNYIPAQDWATWFLSQSVLTERRIEDSGLTRSGPADSKLKDSGLSQSDATNGRLTEKRLAGSGQEAQSGHASEKINISQGIINPFITPSMQESAMLVMAHSHFAMSAFAKAEIGYRELLSTLPAGDIRRPNLNDRLAASLFKQAEYVLASNKVDTKTLQERNINNKNQLSPTQIIALEKGVALLQQVVTDTPLSEFRLAAQYDSAVYFALLENWPKAIATFSDFQIRYPQNELTQGISEQLLYAYNQTQDWPKAANILLAKHTASPTSEIGRLALFQAAEYFEKAGERAKSLIHYRSYAHQYPAPLAEANEARFILSEFYLQSNEASKRRFWLNKLVQAQLALQGDASQQGGLAGQASTSTQAQSSRQGNSSTQAQSSNLAQRSTPRSVYLASFAAMVFATDANTVYTRIKLTQPLATSLQKKQAALKSAIAQYERIISFGSAQFVTAANYKLATLYTTLASDLMDSARPAGLSPLEQSQYEILLEEQAYPFEETAIGMHEKNIARVSSGLYDDWVKQSFSALKSSMPGRYNKPEVTTEVAIDDL